MELKEKVNPIKITDEETGKVYILDFNRETVQFAEDRGFTWEAVGDRPATMIPLIWYTAFRRHDPRISLDKTTKILEKLGGIQPKWVKRLHELYDQALVSLIADDSDEGASKNAKMTVELE